MASSEPPPDLEALSDEELARLAGGAERRSHGGLDGNLDRCFAELVRRANEISPAAGREWGDNDANRSVRSALNKDLEALSKVYFERGKRISAADALAYGIVTEVHPAGELDAAVDGLVDELRALSPLALAMGKRVLNHAYEAPLGAGLEIEGLAYGLLRSTHDFTEGVEAFVEKRTPKFEGR